MPKYITKRNGDKVSFNADKILISINKARNETNEFKIGDSEKLLKDVLKSIKAKGMEEITVEEVQDEVENSLMKHEHFVTARLYIKYRDAQKGLRENPWADNDERQDIILQKYLIEGESKKDFIERISYGNSKLEKIFRNREAIWGGRILFALGRDGNITFSNCYVATPPSDSLKDIYRADYDIARTYSYGGGQGLNVSKIRPKGAKVNNSSNTTPGVMVFVEKYSHTTLNTQQQSRRGALMVVMNIDHPDVIDFITTKLDLNKVQGANISLAVSHDFMQAHENDEDWVMHFETPHEKIEKRVKARELMELIAYANADVGDPGFLLIDKMNDYHLLSEYDEVYFDTTNPCGEQPLMHDGSCNLGSINLNAFVTNPFTEDAKFNFDRFKEVVTEMIWGLDEVLTLGQDRHALPAQIEHVKQWREVGLGVMGLADLALSMNKGYGSPEFLVELDAIMKVMANAAAQASALNAKKLGKFPKFNFEKISNSEFFKNVYDEETIALIKKHGLRNSRLLSIAPTGSISNILGVSGGVEPFFMLGYQRTIKSMFETERTIWVYEKTPLKLMKHLGIESHTKLPAWAQVTSQTIDFEDRSDVQSTIQKYVDTAISSTFNLPNEATSQDVIDIYTTSWKKGLKGATVFRDNCRKIGILTGGGDATDKNPPKPVTLNINESWFNKNTGITEEFTTTITVDGGEFKTEKSEVEVCPECGSHLVKRQGCTQCSNEDCYFEKCAI